MGLLVVTENRVARVISRANILHLIKTRTELEV
jgi:hypothetical protein